jgi:hypothetical protein
MSIITLSHGQTSGSSKLIFLVFSFSFLVNFASTGAHFDPADGVQVFLLTESMVLKHSVKLYSSLNPDLPSIAKLFYKNTKPYNLVDNPTVPTDKPTYSLRSLLLAAIAVPFYYAAIIFSASPITVVALFVNPMIISLTSVVVFCFSLEIYRSKKISFVLSLIFVGCSFILAYNNFFEPQPLQGLCIITAAFFIFISAKRNNNRRIYYAGLAGLFLGFSSFAHPSSVLVLPGFIAYSVFSTRTNRKILFSFLFTLTIMLLLVGLVNYVRFSSFTEFGYGPEESLLLSHHGWSGLLGLLISPGTGLIFYFPIAILAPLAFKRMYRDNKGLSLLFGYVLFVTWLFVGTIAYAEPYGWNGQAWGPRYLVPILPFITIASGFLFLYLKNRVFLKATITILCAVGFYVNLLGVLIWYLYGESYGINVEGLGKYLYLPNGNKIFSWFVTYVPFYSPIVLHTGALASNYPSHLKQTPAFIHSYWSFGNAPCSYDIYLFCKFGITSILLISAVIVFLAVLILAEIFDSNPIFRLKSFNIKRRQC